MPSVGVQILEAIELRVQQASVTLPALVGVRTVTPPEGLTVERDMIRPVMVRDVLDGPHIALAIRGQTDVRRDKWDSPMTIRTLEVVADVFALANEVRGAEATDPAYVWMIQSLQSESTLGGICHYISEEEHEDAHTAVEESADLIATKSVRINFVFHTRTDDPELRNL